MGTAEKLFIGESGQRQSKIGVDHGRDYALFLPSWARNLITAEEPRFPHPHLHRRSSAEVRCGATAVPREHPPTSDRQGGPKAAVAATNRATRSSERRRRFAAALAASQIQYEPDWYDGSHPWSCSDISDFSSGLGGGLASAITAAATPPNSSDGSSSGSDGGSSDGGGGGSGW